jgi:hypothetical protein
MRLNLGRLMPAAGALVVVSSMMPNALAQCALPTKLIKPASWNSQIGSPQLLRAALRLTATEDDSAPIVGMWHVVFTAKTLQGSAIPGTVIDNAVVVWHSDGTEIMNSARPAQDGNFCLGVWEQTGKSTYYLNHLPWAGNDGANAPNGIGNPTGGGQIVERVTLSSDHNSYSGTFKLTAYDLNGNLEATLTGILKATRITTKTPFGSLL